MRRCRLAKVRHPRNGSPVARILVIDDDQPMREVMAAILTRSGHTVVCATNGREGKRCYSEQTPDLIITDIIMPEVDGLEFLRQMRFTRPAIPIIAVCGNPTQSGFLQMAKILGARDTLLKPFGAEQLLDAVNAALVPR